MIFRRHCYQPKLLLLLLFLSLLFPVRYLYLNTIIPLIRPTVLLLFPWTFCLHCCQLKILLYPLFLIVLFPVLHLPLHLSNLVSFVSPVLLFFFLISILNAISKPLILLIMFLPNNFLGLFPVPIVLLVILKIPRYCIIYELVTGLLVRLHIYDRI